MKKELQKLEEGFRGKCMPRSTENNTQNETNWKMLGHEGIHGFWFKKFTSIHDRLAIEMYTCLEETDEPEWIIKG